MKSFEDKNGLEWQVDLDLELVMRIEDYDFGPALRKDEPFRISFFPPDDDLFTSLLTNGRVLFLMVWICCREQAETRGVDSIEEFAKLFDGSAMNRARLAFFEELPHFFPERETSLKALIAAYSMVMQEANDQMTERVHRVLSPERIRQEVKKAMPKELLEE